MKLQNLFRLVLLTVLAPTLCSATYAITQEAPIPIAAAGPQLDPVAATNAYLATVPPDKRAKSDAYFEGGYWLQLWDFLLGVVVALLLLAGGFSARMRSSAARLTRRKPLQTFVYWTQYLLVTTIVLFPMTAYEGFFREHKYGLATQSFGSWMSDQLKSILLWLILGGIIVALLYGVVKRFQRTWWIWGPVVSVLFLAFAQMIAPIYIEPLFNKYTRLEDPAVREPILRLARFNGIDAGDVWVVDASRQSNRVSANVSGFYGTQRIALNDNLLKRCSLGEIEAVMAHEIGHAVLHHIYGEFLFIAVVIVIGFAFLRWSFDRVLKRKGDAWGVSGIGDVTGLPLVVLILSAFFFILTPVTNTYVRTTEAEADLFALNAAHQPDAEAQVDLKLGEYRKLSPGPLEEFLFFDHPSGRSRILMAMRWKADNLRATAEAEAEAVAAKSSR